ncbi:unnamed protein product [Rotaria magnacalcarata]|uniref:ADP ribosyltransferase domain-containing protein n=1 Tax=Rotaria magnacalcarata TaxID=392030 RepID=A0A819T4H4_9BILA|nr:unnamed protein product [Rotaria magnacalcarata]CAF4060521.1 unnamed protein product [Rotaria magnacalcarata]
MEIHEDCNLEVLHLIWLDTTKGNLSDNRITLGPYIRAVVNHLKFFEEFNECQKYVQSIADNERILIITDGQSSSKMISYLSEATEIISVYIYTNKSDENIPITCRSSRKIKAISSQFDYLRKQIITDFGDRRQRCCFQVHEPMSINFSNVNPTNHQSSTPLNGQFMFSRLLLDILLRIPASDTDKDELISACQREYAENPFYLATLNEFKYNYAPDQALLWYTKQSFVYNLLNRALRQQNIELLFLLRFFINDIHEQLQQMQCLEPIRIYRGQVISKDELTLLQNSMGQLISMNSFLSTSISRELALFFLGEYTASQELQQVLFEIDADPRLDGTRPFADISARSYFPEEAEILMMFGSIFRLESMYEERNSKGGTIYVIRMTFCADHNENVEVLYQSMKNDLNIQDIGSTNLRDLGNALIEMGKFNEAERYFRRLLRGVSLSQGDTAGCCYGLGEVLRNVGDYERSIEWYQNALEIRLQLLPFSHEHIGDIYNSIGISFSGKCEHKLALEFYTKALTVWKQVYKEDHPRMAWVFNNIAVVYQKQSQHTESLQFLQKSLKISERELPPDHPTIASSVHNIGDAFASLGQYELALEHYERALNIFKMSRPSDHPYIAYTLSSIGLTYENMNEPKKSLEYFQKSMEIFRETLPENHRYRIRAETGLKRLEEKIKQTSM